MKTLHTHQTQTHNTHHSFSGRSNVGKSSLINAVCRQHGLARTSKVVAVVVVMVERVRGRVSAHNLLCVAYVCTCECDRLSMYITGLSLSLSLCNADSWKDTDIELLQRGG